jgi:hypothetical protein
MHLVRCKCISAGCNALHLLPLKVILTSSAAAAVVVHAAAECWGTCIALRCCITISTELSAVFSCPSPAAVASSPSWQQYHQRTPGQQQVILSTAIQGSTCRL